MKKKRLRKIIGGLSFTTALFVFQACYGTPGDHWEDVYINGRVLSKTTGEPLEGIKVIVDNAPSYEYTNKDGNFSFYAERKDSLKLKFCNGTRELLFKEKDTILSTIKEGKLIDITDLEILMEEKE